MSYLHTSVHNIFSRFSSNYCLLKVNLYHIHTYTYLALHFGVIFKKKKLFLL